MAAQESQACTFQEPESLKDILDLLEKLSDARSLKKSVGQKLVQDVRKYFKETTKFYQSGSSSHSEVLSTVFSNAYGIRGSILQNSRTFDTYNNFDRDHEDHDCVPRALKECLPKAYAALYFLLFMGSNTDFRTLQGGQWKDQNVNGSGRSGTDLCNWLAKEKSVGGATKPLTPGLIKRGFKSGELHGSNDGSTVAPVIKKIIKHESPEALQNALSYLLFVCPWDDALTGHAICFLSTFCSKVLEGPERFLKEPYKEHSGAFKDVCRGLKDSLQPFIDGSSGLSAVCHGNTDLFDSLWDDGKFLTYCDWLKGNIYSVISSLASMSGESSAWDLSTIPHGFSAGPFKYGFVFKDIWGDSGYISKLQGYISKLIGEDSGSLGKLKNFIFNPSTPSSPAATAGGVFTGILGTGGLGAGAAYATNAFGFQNFISGLISGFLK